MSPRFFTHLFSITFSLFLIGITIETAKANDDGWEVYVNKSSFEVTKDECYFFAQKVNLDNGQEVRFTYDFKLCEDVTIKENRNVIIITQISREGFMKIHVDKTNEDSFNAKEIHVHVGSSGTAAIPVDLELVLLNDVSGNVE